MTTAALQISSETETRTAQIIHAVDQLAAQHDQWVDDDRLDFYVPPTSFDLSVENLAQVLSSGLIPQELSRLANRALEFCNLWGQYIDRDGESAVMQRDRHGHNTGWKPHPRCWGAFKRMAEARKEIETRPESKVREPVSMLLNQGVKPAQVARIFATGKLSGPFYRSNGSVDEDAIQQQADYEEGKGGKQILSDDDFIVTPATSTEPDVRDRLQINQKLRELRERSVTREQETRPKPPPADKGTPESLAREGAYPHQVQKTFGLTAQETRDIFQKIEDEERRNRHEALKRQFEEQEESAPPAESSSSVVDDSETAADADETSEAAADDLFSDDEQEAPAVEVNSSGEIDMAELMRYVADLHSRDDSLGPADIARRIEDETGRKVDGRSVSLAIRKNREAAK